MDLLPERVGVPCMMGVVGTMSETAVTGKFGKGRQGPNLVMVTINGTRYVSGVETSRSGAPRGFLHTSHLLLYPPLWLLVLGLSSQYLPLLTINHLLEVVSISLRNCYMIKFFVTFGNPVILLTYLAVKPP